MALPGKTIRSAFLIGQDKYEHPEQFAKLNYACNDVRGMDNVLRMKCGFQVTQMMDAKKADFKVLLRQFAQSLRGCEGAIFLLYYAGHSLWCNGQLFLVPVDAADEDPSSCVNLYDLIKSVHDVAEGACESTRDRAAAATSAQAAPRSTLLIVMDSCRTRPQGASDAQWKAGSMTEAKPPRAITTEVSIWFACDEGKAARESDELQHGFFTAAFIEALECPGLTWDQVCSMARDGCTKASSGRQRPWKLESMSGGAALVLHNRSDIAVSTPALEEGELGESKTAKLTCAALSSCSSKVVAWKDWAWNSSPMCCDEWLFYATMVGCRARAYCLLTSDEIETACFLSSPVENQDIRSVCLLPGMVEAYLFIVGPWFLDLTLYKEGKLEPWDFFFLTGLEVYMTVAGFASWSLLLFIRYVCPFVGAPLIDSLVGALNAPDISTADCCACTALVVLGMSDRWIPSRVRDPEAVRVLRWLESHERWAEHRTKIRLALVCITWLPFWLMQGAACFALLECVRSVPWFLRVPLEVLLAVPLAFCCRLCWLRRVGGADGGWLLLDALPSSVLVSQATCSFFLSFDPSMKGYPQIGSRGLNYEVFITLVAMSAISLTRWIAAIEPPARQQSVPLSCYQPPTV